MEINIGGIDFKLLEEKGTKEHRFLEDSILDLPSSVMNGQGKAGVRLLYDDNKAIIEFGISPEKNYKVNTFKTPKNGSVITRDVTGRVVEFEYQKKTYRFASFMYEIN